MRADREVGNALLDGVLEQIAVPELVQPDRDVRVPLVPDPDVTREQAHRHREHGRELELAGFELEHRSCRERPALERAQRGPCFREQAPAGRGERRAVRQAIEHGPVQLLLERSDVLRERRLRDPDPLRRPGERALVDDRDEAFELADVHRQNLSNYGRPPAT